LSTSGGGRGGEKAGEHGLGGRRDGDRALGYIEVREEGAMFKPIRDPRLMAGAGAGAGAAGLTAFAVRAILRR
jgi:hypothetical protein